MDRRIRKNKTAIKDAFLQQLKIKNINDISVTELCEKADINRSTFYYHYHYIDELIKEIFFDEFSKIEQQLHLPNSFEHKIDNYESLIILLNDIQKSDNILHLLFTKGDQYLFIKYSLEYFNDRFEKTNSFTNNRYTQIFGYTGMFHIIYQ